jgi:GPH family glycoside/pentoside/hexuronide:cation symporter
VALLYASGDIGTSLTTVCLGFYWLYFLIEVAGLPALQAGLIHGSGYVVSAGANLWAGEVLDQRFPAPRQRCSLVAGLGVVLALCFALVWFTPPDPWRAAWFLAISWAFHAVFALVYLAYLSLSAHLGASDAERVDISSYRFGGTMLLTLIALALHGTTEGRLALNARLQLLGCVVAVLGALGSLACGLGLKRAMKEAAPKVAGARPPWRTLLTSLDLRRAVGANLIVWFVVQAALVLTAFLCAAAKVSDAQVLLTLQVSIILAAGLTSVAIRRWTAGRLLAAAAAVWCLGALLWQGGWVPFAAAASLGLGLGAATVLSWAWVAEAVARFSGRAAGAEARAYAGLALSRDMVAATVPMLAALLMNGRRVGSPDSGVAAGLGLLFAALVAAALLFSLRPRPAADAGRVEAPM